jgi:hypothetical protein
VKNAYSKRILGNLIGEDPLRVYEQTPRALSRLTRGLSKKQLDTPPAKGKWSITQLVTHLCDAELVMGFRLRMAIAQPGSPLLAYDQNKWAGRLHYMEMDVRKQLLLFASLRSSHINLLKLLSKAELRRYGIHAERGRESVERMIQMLAGHDINHLIQVRRQRRKLLGRKS